MEKMALVYGEVTNQMQTVLKDLCLKGFLHDYRECPFTHSNMDLVKYFELDKDKINKILRKQQIINEYVIIKGNVHTDDFLRGVIKLNKELGGDRLIHCANFYNPNTEQEFIMTDGACNLALDDELRTKAIEYATKISYVKKPKQKEVWTSLITAGGDYNNKTDSELYDWWLKHKEDYPENSLRLEQLDVALSSDIRLVKKTPGRVADVIVVKDINVGNAIWKSLTVLGCWQCYGILMGSPVPIVLNSRGDSADSIIGSIKLAIQL